jgi:hypothetical protein
MLHLLTPCVCGGTFDRPKVECGHCQLVQLTAKLLREAFVRNRHYLNVSLTVYETCGFLAVQYDLPPADVRRIVGPDTETEESPCP